MTAKTFVDSNILLYAHDVEAGNKQRTAEQVLSELWASRSGVVSPQVLQPYRKRRSHTPFTSGKM